MKAPSDEIRFALLFIVLVALLPAPFLAAGWFEWGERTRMSLILGWDGAILSFTIPMFGYLLVMAKRYLRRKTGRSEVEIGLPEGFALVLSSLSIWLCIFAGMAYAIFGSFWAAGPFLVIASLPVLMSIVLMFLFW